ncbi:MAG: hypothetical protein Q4D65_05960 [Peptostreptococcaceae bacterium]|nr:hypothetical protein [Peptostreptococcaceae bacterium]
MERILKNNAVLGFQNRIIKLDSVDKILEKIGLLNYNDIKMCGLKE